MIQTNLPCPHLGTYRSTAIRNHTASHNMLHRCGCTPVLLRCAGYVVDTGAVEPDRQIDRTLSPARHNRGREACRAELTLWFTLDVLFQEIWKQDHFAST